ncbi:plasmid replication DNA-binding protein [Acinetobacter nectaris]|uniref:plasmid replication DNA-binding protein n=1 Tax=Acinetobacter nectaris TaxID=1219382 RepID=UPI001F1C2C98|nr:plasmid replication DNA-binding protein [Acinetobacter nectaris]MCF9035364.1 hypothetical protein [Acinetobacter nectaris]
MALLTIIQASKDFSIDKGKIYRAIKSGKLTAIVKDNIQYIDHSDMIRVFGNSNKKTNYADRTEPKINQVHEPNEQYIELLKKQLMQSEERERFYKQQIDEIREDFKSYRLLIEHKIQVETELKEPNQTQSEPSSQTERTNLNLDVKPTINELSVEQPSKKRKGLVRGLISSFLDR